MCDYKKTTTVRAVTPVTHESKGADTMKQETRKTRKTTANRPTRTRFPRTGESQRITQSGYTLTILDDYSLEATGAYITLDFSGTAAHVPSLADEAMASIRDRYEHGAASPAYFKIMVSAIERFSEFAKQAGVRSFADYSENLGQRFMEFMGKMYMGEKGGSKKYTLFCWSIPG